MNIQFYLRFHTEFGQSLWISGNSEELGTEDAGKAIAMTYLNDEFWHITIPISKKNWPKKGIRYKYYLKNKEGQLTGEWGYKVITDFPKTSENIQVLDTWNHAG